MAGKADIYQRVQKLIDSGKASSIREACKQLKVNVPAYYRSRGTAKKLQLKKKTPVTMAYEDLKRPTRLVALVGDAHEVMSALRDMGLAGGT